MRAVPQAPPPRARLRATQDAARHNDGTSQMTETKRGPPSLSRRRRRPSVHAQAGRYQSRREASAALVVLQPAVVGRRRARADGRRGESEETSPTPPLDKPRNTREHEIRRESCLVLFGLSIERLRAAHLADDDRVPPHPRALDPGAGTGRAISTSDVDVERSRAIAGMRVPKRDSKSSEKEGIPWFAEEGKAAAPILRATHRACKRPGT